MTRDRPLRHQHPPDEERKIREAALDRTLGETFPASDPLSGDPNPCDDTLIEDEEPQQDDRHSS